MRSLTLIVAVAGAYALLRGWPDGPGLLLRACLAVATLVAGLAYWGSRGKKSKSPARMFSLRRATLLDYLSLGVAIVFTEACFVVFTSTLAGPAQDFALTVHEGVTGISEGEGAGGEGVSENTEGDPSFEGERSGPWIFKRNLERDLPKQSNHKPSNKPEVFVELENSADATALLTSRIHLRAFAFSQFNGDSWSAAPMARSVIEEPIQFTQSASLTGGIRAIRHRVYHAVNPTGQNVFTALHGALSTDVSALTKLAESVYLLPDPEDKNSGYSYMAESRPVHFIDLLDEVMIPAPANDGELSLPTSLAGELTKTAEIFKTEPDTARQLVALRNFLQDNYQYSLETTNADGVNPLENFLYREKRGYCEHFATAAAMLCRAIGVPSRIAYGWSGGRLYKGQNMFVFRAKDAHAWTEIKIQGYGWVVFDTTPPDDDAIPEAHTAPDGEKAPDPAEALNVDQSNNESAVADPGIGIGAGVNHIRLTIALGLLCLCAIGFLAVRYIKRVDTAPDGRPITHPQPGYLLHFKQASAALGHPIPLGRTLRQHMDVLADTDCAPDFSERLLSYHYGLIYGGAKKTPSLEKQLNRAIRRWKTTVTVHKGEA